MGCFCALSSMLSSAKRALCLVRTWSIDRDCTHKQLSAQEQYSLREISARHRWLFVLWYRKFSAIGRNWNFNPKYFSLLEVETSMIDDSICGTAILQKKLRRAL